MNQIIGRHLFRFAANHHLNLWRQLYGLGSAGKYATAFGNKFCVVVLPGGTFQRKQSLTLFKTFGGIRFGIKKNVHMIECSE